MRPLVFAESITVVTAAFLAAGAAIWAHWILTGDFTLMRWYFDHPVEIFLVFAPAAQWMSTWLVSESYDPDEPMRRGWELASYAAAIQLTGNFIVHVVATPAQWNPAAQLFSYVDRETVRKAGTVLAGPIALSLLGVALHRILRIVHGCGISPRWRVRDWVLLAAGAIFVSRHVWELAVIWQRGWSVDPVTKMNWALDPILMYVLYMAVRLRQTAHEFGDGCVARCWQAYAAGLLLTFAGDVGLWLPTFTARAWPWNSLFWFVWIPAAGCFALAPSLQWAAIQQAVRLPVTAGATTNK